MNIDSFLLDIGIFPNKAAFKYIKVAMQCDSDSAAMCEVYKYVADSCSTTTNIVYDSIRRAIMFANTCGKLKNINNYFDVEIYSEEKGLTTSEFLSLLKFKFSSTNVA